MDTIFSECELYNRIYDSEDTLVHFGEHNAPSNYIENEKYYIKYYVEQLKQMTDKEHDISTLDIYLDELVKLGSSLKICKEKCKQEPDSMLNKNLYHQTQRYITKTKYKIHKLILNNMH